MKANSKRLFLLTIVATLILPLSGLGQNGGVAGTWKMNREKSKFASGEGPLGITIKFEQQEQGLREWLTVQNSRGERTLDLTYKVDGSTEPAQLDGREVKTMAKWEGGNLVIVLTESDGSSFTRKFSLSQDGKTLTIAVHHSNPRGETDDTVVLEKH